MLIGTFAVICQEKQSTAASVGLRAFVAGSFVNFVNASIVGSFNFLNSIIEENVN